jgi:hypothetical protein
MSKPPFSDLDLPEGTQRAADSFVNMMALLAQHDELNLSYADIIAGLLYAMPAMLAMGDDEDATVLMAKRVQKYVAAPEFVQTVSKWLSFFKTAADDIEREEVAEAIESGSIASDLMRDPRYN